MKIGVRYYPPFDELAGRPCEELMLEGSAVKVSDFLRFLAGLHPRLRPHVETSSDEASRRRMIVFVGPEAASLSDEIHDGDNVKMLPPIMGGAGSQ